MDKQKTLWFNVSPSTSPSVLEAVFNCHYSTLMVPPSARDRVTQIPLPQHVDLAVGVNSMNDVAAVEADRVLFSKTRYLVAQDLGVLEEIKQRTQFKAAISVRVDDRHSLDWSVANSSKADVLLLDFKDPTNIPLELVLATTQPLETRIFKKVKTAQDGEVSLMTMEKGSDGILLESDDIGEISRLSQAFEKSSAVQLALSEATVTRVTHCGMGDRVCVDTTSELFTNEGMLIGSTSRGGLLVCSETHYLPYMNLRPFRVNAGALHSYVWGPDNFVGYLSDLRAGQRVYVVDTVGNARVATVGRVKIERRPLLNIEADVGPHRLNVFIQDDWHVRIFGAGGEVRPSSEVQLGDKLMAFVDSPGRHVGIKISESIQEN